MADDNEGAVGCVIWIIIMILCSVFGKKDKDKAKRPKKPPDKVKKLPIEELPKKPEQDVPATPPAPPVAAPTPDPAPPVVEKAAFWPEEYLRSQEGYLMSKNYIPLRAIARRPNVMLFPSQENTKPLDCIDTMQPWHPYFVFDYLEKKGLLCVGDAQSTPPEARFWAKGGDVFCWTTRECINMEAPSEVYPSLEQARDSGSPIDTTYMYPYKDNFDRTAEEKGTFRMASLPVLHRVQGEYWCIVRPEGDELGYQLCWVDWDGVQERVQCRMRVTRHELESYISGIRKMMIDYKYRNKKPEAKAGLYRRGQDFLTRHETSGPLSVSRLMKRQRGIPKLGGFLERPIEDPLQYEEISKRVIQLIVVSGIEELWSEQEVAFVPLSMLP